VSALSAALLAALLGAGAPTRSAATGAAPAPRLPAAGAPGDPDAEVIANLELLERLELLEHLDALEPPPDEKGKAAGASQGDAPDEAAPAPKAEPRPPPARR